MDPEQARRALAGLRLALGAMWVTPRFGTRVMGLDPDAAPSLLLMARLFAVRDVALAIAALQARGQEADRQTDLGIMVDAADLAALVLAVTRRHIRARTFVLGSAMAAAAVGLGATVRRSAAERLSPPAAG